MESHMAPKLVPLGRRPSSGPTAPRLVPLGRRPSSGPSAPRLTSGRAGDAQPSPTSGGAEAESFSDLQTVESTSFLEPSPTVTKPPPPKTMREVALQYNFTLESVMAANSSLGGSIGPDDAIPKGTTLALPKRNANNTPPSVASPEAPQPLASQAASSMQRKPSVIDVVRAKQLAAAQAAKAKEEAQERALAALEEEEQHDSPARSKSQASLKKVQSTVYPAAHRASSMVTGQKPAPKKAAPKTLREVSEMYDFPLVEVYEATPDLIQLGPDDKLPLGTKLQLPKRKPTWIQIVAQLSVQESQARQLVVSSFDKEDDNFWYLLRLEKKSQMKLWEEQQVLWKAHKVRADEISKERLADLRRYADDECERRILLLSRLHGVAELHARRQIDNTRIEEWNTIVAMEAFFNKVIVDYFVQAAELTARQDDEYAELVWSQDSERVHVAEKCALVREMLNSADPQVYALEASERSALQVQMAHEEDVIRQFEAMYHELNAEIRQVRDAVASEEHNERAAIEDFSKRHAAFIADLYVARTAFEESGMEGRKRVDEEERAAREALEATLVTWTKKLSDWEATVQQTVDHERDAEDALHSLEAKDRGDLSTLCAAHEDWTNDKLKTQAAAANDEQRARGELHDAWVTEYRIVMLEEAPDRVEGFHRDSRLLEERHEHEERDHLTQVADWLHGMARRYHDLLEALVQEGFVACDAEMQRLLTEAYEEYDDKSSAVVRDEALARRNDVLSVEAEGRTKLNRDLIELNNIARRLWAIEEGLVKRQDDEAWQMTQDEQRDWDRMIAWHVRRVKMIEEGKTEIDMFVDEENHARSQVSAARDDDRFRISTLYAESMAEVRRKLNEQSDMYYQEHQARKILFAEEEHTRKELAQMMAEEGRKAWREYMERMFVELVARIEAGEASSRPHIVDEEVTARKQLIADEKNGVAAAKADEAARLLRERLIAEMKEKHRRERLLVERSCLSDRESIESEWRSLAFGLNRDVAIIDREAIQRTELTTSEDDSRYQVVVDRFNGALQVDRDGVDRENLQAYQVLCDEEEEDFQSWRKQRLAEHYEIWMREIAERLRMQKQDREDMEAEEGRARVDEQRDEHQAYLQFLHDEKDGVKEAHRLEEVHAEELRRAIKEWQERMWFARKKLGDEEAEARDAELRTPESEQWMRLSNAEGRARHKAYAAGEERIRKEREAEEARIAEQRRKQEEEHRRRQEELEAERQRQRDIERKKLQERQLQQRQRFDQKQTTARGAIEALYDDESEKLKQRGEESRRDAHSRTVARDFAAHFQSLDRDQAGARENVFQEFMDDLPRFHGDLEYKYNDAKQMVHESRLRRVWTTFISMDNVEAAIDLELDEALRRKEVAYEYDTSYRAWVDAIAIEERMIELAGRRRTTQQRLALNEDEFEERSLVYLLEGLLRVQMEERFDRDILMEWEERCTDALHAHAIDTIDSLLQRGPWMNPFDGPLLLLPECPYRPEFPESTPGGIPSLACSSVALTPRPPMAPLATIATTPGRLQHRVRSFELRGEVGSARQMYSMMERFDTECRSELSTPFVAAGVSRGVSAFASPRPTGGYSTTLPALMPPTPTKPNTLALTDRGAKTPRVNSVLLPAPPINAAVRARNASVGPSAAWH